MRKAEITNLYKKTINIKIKKNRPRFLLTGLIALSLILILNFTLIGDSLNSLITRVSYVYNPVNSLYNDNSSAIFTNGSFFEKETLNFVIPIKTTSYRVSISGEMEFDVISSIMVMSTEAGVIEEVGTTLDGIKYIKIKHGTSIYSIVENVDMIGVEKGNIVKKGQDIATATLGDKIVLRIFENDTQVSNVSVNQSKIVWQK